MIHIVVYATETHTLRSSVYQTECNVRLFKLYFRQIECNVRLFKL